MDELIANIVTLGVPGIVAGILGTLAYIISERIKSHDKSEQTKENEKDVSTEKEIKQSSNVVDTLLDAITTAKMREDDCLRSITALAKERDALVARFESKERMSADELLAQHKIVVEKTHQIDALFAIMRRNSNFPNSMSPDSELKRMREWMIEAFSDDELEAIAADAKLSTPIKTAPLETKVLELIEEAKRKNRLTELGGLVLAARPTKPPW